MLSIVIAADWNRWPFRENLGVSVGTKMIPFDRNIARNHAQCRVELIC